MKNIWFAGALALTFASTAALAGEAADNAATTVSVKSPAWLGNVAGEKLVAVDGSTITLSQSDGGMALALVPANGAAQKSAFVLMSDKLGTIEDDSNRLIGFFRVTESGLEEQFADGHTQSLRANGAGGLSMTIRISANDATCMAWYPAGHVFDEAEKRAALAAYADRLGLSAPAAAKGAHTLSTCAPEPQPAKSVDQPRVPQTLAAVHPTMARARRGAANFGAKENMASGPILVRTSDVHTIDGPAMPLAMTPPVVKLAAQIAPSPPPSAPQPTSIALTTSVQAGHGASDCLSVDTDGANLGFRNKCGFTVQFSYCLQKASDPAVACDAGAKDGDVAANGFASLLSDMNIKADDAEHDFRWVACSGNRGEVEVHLDHSDPPAGRCVRISAS